MHVKMVVSGLTIDPGTHAPMLILRALKSERVLPLSIGVIEARAIAFELDPKGNRRPVVHDLLQTVVERFGGRVRRVIITALRNDTYYAAIDIGHGAKTIRLDARPCDAIALAMRAGSPILCDSDVIRQTAVRRAAQRPLQFSLPAGLKPPVVRPTGRETLKRKAPAKPVVLVAPPPGPADPSPELKALLANLAPTAFGKYKM